MPPTAARGRRAIAASLPDYAPQLATSGLAAPGGEDWLHELSYAGERLCCVKRRTRVKIAAPSGEDCTSHHAALAAAVAELPAQALLLDGELTASTYFAFDLLHLDGVDTRPLPLEERKQLLRELLRDAPPAVLKYVEHVQDDGPRVLRQACKLGATGIVSKRRSTGHNSGPSADWVLTLCAPKPGTALIHGVPISTPTRLLYPALGFSKRDLVQLYAEIAGWVLPHVRGRPLTLVRCEHGATRPDALRSECKFLRHASGWHRWVPSHVQRVQIREREKLGEYLVIQREADLLAILNGDILELHTWNATVARLEQPDRLVFDLDPASDVAWPDVIAAARLLRAQLQTHGLESWVKSTGGKGLHVCVPLAPQHGWDSCYELSRRVALQLERAAPRIFTTRFEKLARHGKILIDYKRNHRAAVAVAALSPRARPHAPISVPLSWRELAREPAPDRWTVNNLRTRLQKLKQDPWADYWSCQQTFAAAR